LSFEDRANLDEGEMWPTGFGIKLWNQQVATRVRELISTTLS